MLGPQCQVMQRVEEQTDITVSFGGTYKRSPFQNRSSDVLLMTSRGKNPGLGVQKSVFDPQVWPYLAL